MYQLQISVFGITHETHTARLMFVAKKRGESIRFCVQTFQKEDIMLYYRDEETMDSIAVVFEGDELELGFRVMEDLLKIMKANGGTAAPEMEQWIRETKALFLGSRILQ